MFNSTLAIRSLVLLAHLTPLPLLGCGSTTNVVAARVPEAKQDEVIRYRAVLAELAKHPRAKEASVELEKARAWLETAQDLMSKDPEAERTRLYLEAVRAQLIRIKSTYARREAEAAAGLHDKPAPSVEGDMDKEQDR